MKKDSSSSGPAAASKARHWVIVSALVLAVIQLVDRVCISQAAPQISSDLKLSKEQLGWVFGAFTLAYAVFEIPTGYWGDRVGPRKVLLRVVLWWSFFTAATGAVWNWASLVGVRFLFGAGEAGCFPNLTKTFDRWLPARERIRAQGLMWMSARWGGAVTPYLVFLVLGVMPWRWAFVLFGSFGVVWAVLFARWYRDNPSEHPSVNAAELELLPEQSRKEPESLDVPWRVFVRSKSLWLLCGQYFACSYSWYFFVTWFPTYLLDVHHFELRKSALLAGVPLFLGGIGSILSGWIHPWVHRRTGDPRLARRLLGVASLAGSAICLITATQLSNPLAAVFAIGLASFFTDIAVPASWATCMDIGGRYVGTVSGAMNMMGNLGGFVSPIVLGRIVERTGDWNLTFYLTAGIYGLGCICWWLLDPVTPLEEESVR